MVWLPVLNTFTVNNEDYPLGIRYKVNDAKNLKIKNIIIAVSLGDLRLPVMYVESFN